MKKLFFIISLGASSYLFSAVATLSSSAPTSLFGPLAGRPARSADATPIGSPASLRSPLCSRRGSQHNIPALFLSASPKIGFIEPSLPLTPPASTQTTPTVSPLEQQRPATPKLPTITSENQPRTLLDKKIADNPPTPQERTFQLAVLAYNQRQEEARKKRLPIQHDRDSSALYTTGLQWYSLNEEAIKLATLERIIGDQL